MNTRAKKKGYYSSEKENNKLFKRAAFTHSTKEGTIEKYNSDLLPADWP